MTTLMIYAIISGIFTLIITAPIMSSRPKTCYLLMLVIPSLTLAGTVWMQPTLIWPENVYSGDLFGFEKQQNDEDYKQELIDLSLIHI